MVCHTRYKGASQKLFRPRGQGSYKTGSHIRGGGTKATKQAEMDPPPTSPRGVRIHENQRDLPMYVCNEVYVYHECGHVCICICEDIYRYMYVCMCVYQVNQ